MLLKLSHLLWPFSKKILIYFTVFDYFNTSGFDTHQRQRFVLSAIDYSFAYVVNFSASRVYKENEIQISLKLYYKFKSYMLASYICNYTKCFPLLLSLFGLIFILNLCFCFDYIFWESVIGPQILKHWYLESVQVVFSGGYITTRKKKIIKLYG